jgi:hypothetical protein
MIILAWSFALGPAPARAADIRMSPSARDEPTATIEGKLEIGDFEKIKTFLQSNRPIELYLASPGGNLGEAMKIGLMVRSLNLSTIVPSKPLTNQARQVILSQRGVTNSNQDYMCASACFFIFVAGVHRRADDVGAPLLGIHHPFVPGNDLAALKKNSAIDAEGNLENIVSKYLKAMDVPGKYFENMFATPKGKILWIRSNEFEDDFDGFIPRLKQLVENKCQSELGNNRVVCERNIEDELARRGYNRATGDTTPTGNK